eukprot:436217_1
MLNITHKDHSGSNFFTRNGYTGDTSKIQIIPPFMHNMQHIAERTVEIHLNYIAPAAAIQDIGNIKKVYTTAMNNKSQYINTSATHMREASRLLSETAPLQIKECDDPTIAALYPISILSRCIDRVIYFHDSIQSPKIRLMYRICATVLAYVPLYSTHGHLIHYYSLLPIYVGYILRMYRFDVAVKS